MKVDGSILEGVRNSVVGVEDNKEFDSELIPYINSSIFNLNQNGVGNRIMVNGDLETWGDLINIKHSEDIQKYISIPLYIALNTKLLFDPPPPSNVQYHDGVVKEMLWRLKIEFEENTGVKYKPVSERCYDVWQDESKDKRKGVKDNG